MNFPLTTDRKQRWSVAHNQLGFLEMTFKGVMKLTTLFVFFNTSNSKLNKPPKPIIPLYVTFDLKLNSLVILIETGIMNSRASFAIYFRIDLGERVNFSGFVSSGK